MSGALHKIEIYAPLEGGAAEVRLDGKVIDRVLAFKIEGGAGQLTRVNLQLFAEVRVRGVAEVPPPAEQPAPASATRA